MESYERNFLFILATSIAACAIISVFMTQLYDMGAWGEVSSNIISGEGLYRVQGYYYTPVWGYFLSLITYVGSLFGIVPTMTQYDALIALENYGSPFSGMITDYGFTMLVKGLMFISFLVTSYLIYRIVSEWTGNKKKSLCAASIWLMCPLVVVIIARSAMFETLTIMIALCSLILLWRGNYFLAGFFLMLSALTKYFPIFLVFIFCALIFVRYKGDINAVVRNIGAGMVGAIASGLLVYWPQILDGTIMGTFSFITSRAGGGPVGYYYLSVSIIALLLCIIIALVYCKHGTSDSRSFFKAVLLTMLVAFFLPVGPEQYYIMLVPFLAIGAVLIDKKIGYLAMVSMALMAISPIATTWPSDFLTFMNTFCGNLAYASLPSITIVDNILTGIGIVVLWGCTYVLIKDKGGVTDGS